MRKYVDQHWRAIEYQVGGRGHTQHEAHLVPALPEQTLTKVCWTISYDTKDQHSGLTTKTAR